MRNDTISKHDEIGRGLARYSSIVRSAVSAGKGIFQLGTVHKLRTV